MNKAELITEVSERTKLTQKDLKIALESMLETIGDTVAKGEKVQLVGFGNFEPRERAERKGRNPKTKEEIIIPASKSAGFKVSSKLKEKVNK